MTNTKATKVQKVTKTTGYVFVAILFFVALGGAQQPAAPTQAQQRPVFRGGTHFVRVDAYPAEDGHIVEGLKPEDFEVLEDGKRQAIESFDFIKFDTFTPEAERRDPGSQRAGFDMAADPRYRVFVVYVDMALSTSAGAVVRNDDLPRIQQPLVSFFERIVGPQDLYGFLTSRNSVKDLVLAQKTSVTIEQIRDLWRARAIDRDDADILLDNCSCGPNVIGQACRDMIEALKLRFRADASYANLGDIVAQLGSLRQERKNLVLATNLLPRWRPDDSYLNARGPRIPITGIATGQLPKDDPATNRMATGSTESTCNTEFQRLAMMDFEPRYRQLVDDARRENVSFYVVAPGGLQAPVTVGQRRQVDAAYDDLKSLADETGGLAIVNTNDLTAGMKRIADDLAAYYLLGYYASNTKFDGGIRKISVKVKGKTIRARRQYRAPTEAELSALASSASSAGSAGSAASAPSTPAIIGEPIAYRVGPRQAAEKVSLLEFVRADRIRVEWPVLAALDRREARVLDSAGKPLPIDLPVAEGAGGKTLVVELPLAPFGRGVYSIELTAGSGAATERRRLTFTMK